MAPFCQANASSRTIACVGDSITFGYGVAPHQATQAWPALLQGLLAGKAHVVNLGICGSTAQRTGDAPYTSTPEYAQSLQVPLAIYLVMLGTNDANPANWDPARFQSDYCKLLQAYIDKTGSQRVIALLPPTAFAVPGSPLAAFDVSPRYLTMAVQSIALVARELHVAMIDLYHLTAAHPEWFVDGVHPNEEGNRQIAAHVHARLACMRQ